jgi:hypothetical protein
MLKIILMEVTSRVNSFTQQPIMAITSSGNRRKNTGTTLQKRDILGCYLSLLKSFLNLGPFFSSSTTLRLSQKKTTLQNHAVDDCHLQLRNF